MSIESLKYTLEAALLAAVQPVGINKMLELFANDEKRPSRDDIRMALSALGDDYQNRGIELIEVASGFRVQVRQEQAPWIARLWDEKPPRYSRALLETLALVAYRQPITRAEIEDVRGVSVSTQIVRTLLEREWVRVVGHRDVPGKPAMFGTTRQFLDYFNLKRLDELPALSEIRDLDSMHPELALEGERRKSDRAEGGQLVANDAGTEQAGEVAEMPPHETDSVGDQEAVTDASLGALH
jgi:segregation and condensation protein B